MPTITSEDFLSYYERDFGVGIDRLKELLPKGSVLNLDDFIQAPDQLWPDFASSPLDDTARNSLLDAWARLRAKSPPDPEDPFLPVHDPSIEHGVNPPPPGEPLLPPGLSPTDTVSVDGERLPLGNKLAALGLTAYGGKQVFVKHVATINTQNWSVTGGRVHFKLMEGPNHWGPWTRRCDFSLGPDETHEGCVFNRLAWWALVVSSAVPSKFTALPFIW